MSAATSGSRAMSRDEVRRAVALRTLLAIPVLGLWFFLPAGTLRYWESWLYMGVLLIPLFAVLAYFVRNDPAFLERRMRMREQEAEQRTIIKLSIIWFLLVFLLPGFDHRFGWSDVPAPLVIVADLVVLLGYGLIALVFRENRYASRVVEVTQGQQVISSGPYAIVRHPMYVGVLMMYLATPIALGSWWAFLPGLLIVPILVARILNEEKVLARDLPGYTEYTEKVRYRLIPGIW